MKIITDKNEDVRDVIGPFDEDATLILICIVTGGKDNNSRFLFQISKMSLILFTFLSLIYCSSGPPLSPLRRIRTK